MTWQVILLIVFLDRCSRLGKKDELQINLDLSFGANLSQWRPIRSVRKNAN